MANKDLFKQAIAEAKSVREAAIANAKEALEETLTPHLKDMLAAKLQEMEDKDMEEAHGDNQAHEKNPADQLEEELTFEEEHEEEEAENDSEESEDEAEEEIEVKDMEVEDLKNLIRDIIAQEMGAGEAEQMPADELPADDMVGAEDEEEIDLDELLREISEMSYEEEVDEYGSSKMKEPSEAAAAESAMRNRKEEGLNEEPVSIAAVAAGLAAIFGGSIGFVKLTDKLEAGDFGPAGQKIANQLSKMGKAAGSAMRNEAELGEVTEYSSELEEAMDTIEELRGQLQEVNLLNAKLLYVNKVFKANNLTESQKVNVIAAFDKAETVKEVKLVFETVANNVVTKTAKTSIKESKLGMASKATGITAKKPEVITEANEAIRRMQKLAGIIK